MWNCIKGCLREALPGAGIILIAGLVAGIIGLVGATGGGAAFLALGALAIAKAIGIVLGGVVLVDAVGTFIGCLVGCLIV